VRFVLLTFFSSICFLTVKAFPQISSNQQKFVISAVKVSRDINLTGTLLDPLWRTAPTVQCPYEIQPGDNIPAAQKTWVKILYNSRYLYLGFICKDTDPSTIRAHVTDRDKIFEDDFVIAIIDPFQDNQRAYEFLANPLGIQSDLMRNNNNEDPSWDAVWYSKGAVDDTGYTVEIAIPFKSIRFPDRKKQDWTLMLGRNYPRESRKIFSWTTFDKNNPCFLCNAGTLEGLEDLQSTSALELLPYSMGLQSGESTNQSDPASNFENGKVKGRIGGGIKYLPNPSLSLEGVANPDFSQVESDATQISVNTTFAIFYPEKRPFFLDGSDMFKTKINGFYSRMINNPLAAAKIASKSKHFTLAYLAAADRNSAFIVPGEEASSFVSTSLKSFSNVFRGKYEFGKQSYLGTLITTRNFKDAHNYAGGVDWNLFFHDNYTFSGQFLISNTRELYDTTLLSDAGSYGTTKFTRAFDGQIFTGVAGIAELRRDSKHYNFSVRYKDFSPTFQTQNGFVAAVDYRMLSLGNGYQFYPEDSFIDSGYLFTEMSAKFNYAGARKERWLAAGISLQMKNQINLNLTVLPYNEELFNSVRFNKIYRMMLNIYASPSSVISVNLNMAFGRFIDRQDPPTLGFGHDIYADLVLKPTERLSFDASYQRSRLKAETTNNLIYDGYIGRLTSIYQFNQQLFFRVIGEYNSFARSIEIDPLFSFKLNPFTIFYAGSTHSLTDFGLPYGVKQTSRQFFIKLQYLWNI